MVEEVIKDNYSRFKGASWFPKLKDRAILIIGQGGIGSWLSLLVARTGANLYLYDGDTVEAHNQSGQLFGNEQIGDFKVDAIQNIIEQLCDNNIGVEIFKEMYNQYSPSNSVILTGLDNMVARKVVFNNWIKFLEENPDKKDESILIDGRLNAESFSIFCIKGNDLKSQESYQKTALFNDSEAEEQDCSLKQTSHLAACVASHMVSFLCNFHGEEFRDTPYFYRYDAPINFTTDVYD